MDPCCAAQQGPATGPHRCPGCDAPGRPVDRITVKALLRPEGLMRLTAPDHRFCPTAECTVVYFGLDQVFTRQDVRVPVFQKEPPGERTVCYCFEVTEEHIRRELTETGRSAAAERITQLVEHEQCACEVRNPQGTCCLGNVVAVTKAAGSARRAEVSRDV